MDAKTTADTLKRLAFLKHDGTTSEIRAQAAQEYGALKAKLLVEAARAQDWRK